MGLTASDWIGVIVAAATIFLGLATFRMARQTRGVAEATRRMAQSTEIEARSVTEQATLTRASLQASIQPWLTRVTPPISEPRPLPRTAEDLLNARVGEEPHIVYVVTDNGGLRVTFWMRNVGSGVALLRAQEGCLIEGKDPNDKPVTRHGFPSAAALPPGEATRLAFVVQHVDVPHFLSRDRNTHGEFWVHVLYTDVNTEQPVWARVHITATDRTASEWLVHRIEYIRDGKDAPFASVQFDAGILSSPA